MFEKIIALDKQLLVFLNNLGSETWDDFWFVITDKFCWTPVYLVVMYLMFRFFGWKKTLFTLFLLALFITFSDQFTNLIRVIFKRLRPNNDPIIQHQIRRLHNSANYSFISGHATTSTMVTVFVISLLKPYTKYIQFFVIFPLFFAYSRIYLGVHFPIDILTGATVGGGLGFLFFKLHGVWSRRVFKHSNADE